MKTLKNITEVVHACLGTGPKVKTDLRGGMVVLVPTYVVLDEKAIRRCSSKLHELIAKGLYYRLTSRTSRTSLEKALKRKLLNPNRHRHQHPHRSRSPHRHHHHHRRRELHSVRGVG